MDTLGTSIDAGTAQIVLTDTSGFPPSGGTIQIDYEEMTYDYITGNTLGGVLRGQNETEATYHDAGAIVAEIQTEYFYVLGHAVKAIDNVYVINRNNDENIRQTVNFTTYTGQSGNEHASYPGKAVIKFTVRPSIAAQVNLEIEDSIDVDDQIGIDDPDHSHSDGLDVYIWEFEYAQYTVGSGGLWADKLSQICDGSLGVQDDFDASVESAGWLQGQGTKVEISKAYLEEPSGAPVQYRVNMAVGFMDGNTGIKATFSGSATGNKTATGIHRGPWKSYSGTWTQFNNLTCEVERTGTNPGGYVAVNAVWIEVKYYVTPAVSTGVSKDDTVYKTGTVELTGNSVADTVIGGEVSADVRGFQADDSGDYGTEDSVIERPDYISKHFLVNYCGLSIADNIGSTYSAAGTLYASENILLSVVIAEVPDVNELLSKLAFQSKSINWWEGGKHQLKYIPFIDSSNKTVDGNRIDAESINLYYTPRTDIYNTHSGIYYKEWVGPFKEDEESYREITKQTSSTSQGIFGVLESDPHKFDYILNQSQAERILSWLTDGRSFPRLVVEFTGWYYLSDIQIGDTIDFSFDSDSQLDKAFLGLVTSESTLFRVIGINRDEVGNFNLKAITVASETTDSACFDASEDGYSQDANFYDSTLAIPIGDYNGSPIT
jgi:hypothetical protein